MSTRREFLSLGAAAILPLAGCATLLHRKGDTVGRLPETRVGNRAVVLTAREHDVALRPDRGTTPAWLYNGQLLPVLRMRQGETLDVTLRNELPEHTSIHWHGVRAPNGMDGVPYLTQAPVMPSEQFRYRFVPPDAGTFFFHPHCDTAAQLGRGLVGALIVEDAASFDDDVVLLLKDWRLDEDGGFLPFLTPSGASRAGTFGTLRTVNGVSAPRMPLRGSEIRLRLINADSTRIMEIGIAGADAKVIAIDGNPVEPFFLDTWRLGPAMRVDLAMDIADDVRLLDYFAATPVTLATLVPDGRHHDRRERALTAPGMRTDFSNPRRHTVELGAGLEAGVLSDPQPVVLPDGRTVQFADALCLASDTFWTLDGTSWPGRTHRNLPPPLFSLTRGENVVLDLENTTSRAHPIHVHGHTMTVLGASILHRPVHNADTVLVLPNERVTVGFVADNPGSWMIHCHVIEHQETGMMGWFRVS
jgi:FtsP/CotA-like multicopper oxidase with cupredoxin domain